MSGLICQEMKCDEVCEWMEVVIDWIVENVRLLIGIVVVIVVGLLFVVLLFFVQVSWVEVG